MIDQIVIGDKASFDDFGASVFKRARKQPKKKTIKETVPFSNITHDFTAINGEIYWEEGTLEYALEMSASSPEKLEIMKDALSSWLMNVIKEELHDPLAPDYHYIVTYDDMNFDDEEGLEKTTVTVSFTAYPYKIANYPKVHEVYIPAKSTLSVWIQNDSSHRITPTITADNPVILKVGSTTYSMSAGTAEDEAFKLQAGMNNVEIKNSKDTDCNMVISFYEEVF